MSDPIWPIIPIPEQEAAITKQIEMMEPVQECDKCMECKHYNYEYNGCNHGHNYYCGREEGDAQ